MNEFDAPLIEIKLLFETLKESGYFWRPLSPEKVKKLRESVDLNAHRLESNAMRDTQRLIEHFAWGTVDPTLLEHFKFFGMAQVSNWGDAFVVHDRWPYPGGLDTVYCGEETGFLVEEIFQYSKRQSFNLDGKRILDIGSGSGAIGFALNQRYLLNYYLGVEASLRAVQWSKLSALAQGVVNLNFEKKVISRSDVGLGSALFDVAISNPPMIFEDSNEGPLYRNGGKFGVECPHLFLDFAHAELVQGGTAFFIVTNPIKKGKSLFYDFDKKKNIKQHWEIRLEKVLNPYYNQSSYREKILDHYGIERVELLFLVLVKR